jgi:hypothetical protein
MTQRDLNRAVARATGETVTEIARRGFVLLTARRRKRKPLVIDWDQLDAQRIGVLSSRRRAHCHWAR